MKIAICENEKIFSEDNRKKLMEYIEERKIQGEIFEFSSGEEFLSCKEEFDILLLDIEMSVISGIEVKKRLEERKSKTGIIFLTSHSEYMSDAFGKYVYKFLSKPVKKDELFQALDRITKEILCDFYIELEDEKRPYLSGRSIIYIVAEDKYSIVKTMDEHFLIRKTLKEWEVELMGYDFYRANKSYIVNMAYIKKIGLELVLEDGKKILLGRNNEKIFRENYNLYLRKILG